jgi:hypothetical protein
MVISAHVRHATSAEASRVPSAKTTNMSSAEATHGTSAEAATAPVSSATTTTTAAASLRARRKQRPGQQGGCQYHHRSSSSHDSFLSMARAISDHFSSRADMVVHSQSLTGNFEGIDRSSRWRRASTQASPQ